MQVFMPYPSLKKSVITLDPKRLGNQIYREAYTLSLGNWPNHPASKIWINHKKALALYCLYGLQELKNRGRDYPKWVDFFNAQYEYEPDTGLPAIIGYKPFHQGHRAALLGKDFSWYNNFGWTEKPEPDTKKAYVWSIPD